jgi:hypothetical protein
VRDEVIRRKRLNASRRREVERVIGAASNAEKKNQAGSHHHLRPELELEQAEIAKQLCL